MVHSICCWLFGLGSFLQDNFDREVDSIVRPIQEEMTRMYAKVAQASMDRDEDRRDLATLWPAEYLMPSILIKYKVG